MNCGLFLILALMPFPAMDEPEAVYLKRTAASWASDLPNSDVRIRRAALFALGKLGKAALPHLGQLKPLLLNDPDAAIRSSAASTLGELGPWAGNEVVTILMLSWDKEKELTVRRQLALALGKQGERASIAEPLLSKALDEKDALLRQQSAWAIGQAGKCTEPTLAKLMSLCTDAETGVRREAIGALGNCGTLAQEAIPLLTRALGDSDSRVQEQATLALRKMGSLAQTSIPSLLSIAENKAAERSLRQAALISIETIWPTGWKAPEAWTRLQTLTQTADDEAVKTTAQEVEKKVAVMRQK